jgi:hypothetical protein
MKGISTDRNISRQAACLLANGIEFVFRYYSQYTTKRITPAECQNLSAKGLKICAVYEDGLKDEKRYDGYYTYNRGLADDRLACAQAKVIGQPSKSAIYYAIDFDPSATQIANQVVHYFQGVLKSMALAGGGQPDYAVGVYGSGRVCEKIKQELSLAKSSWLAASPGWNGWRQYKEGNLWDVLQVFGGSQVCGLTVDDGNGGAFEYNNSVNDIGSFDLKAVVPMAATEMVVDASRETLNRVDEVVTKSPSTSCILNRASDGLRNLAAQMETLPEKVKISGASMTVAADVENAVDRGGESYRLRNCADSLRIMLKDLVVEVATLENRVPGNIEVARECIRVALACVQSEIAGSNVEDRLLTEPEERRRHQAQDICASLVEISGFLEP